MATVTKTRRIPPKPSGILREDTFRQPKSLRVDPDKGIIYGCKMCGLESKHGRSYLREAFNAARHLYEGVACNVDHGVKSGESRKTLDRIGRWVNVRVESDGLYGDLEYLKEHPQAKLLVEAAQRMPEQLGFSPVHDPGPDGMTYREGRPVVHKIYEAHSVDLVADPATTRGLFEGTAVATTSLRRLLTEAKYTGNRKLWARLLLEDGEMPMDQPVATDAGTDPDAALIEGFRAAMLAIFEKYQGGELDAAGAGKLIAKYLKAHEKLMQAGEPEAPADAPDTGPSDGEDDMASESGKKPSATEIAEAAKLKTENAELKRKLAVSVLCESKKFIPSEIQRKALEKMDTDEERASLIAESFARTPARQSDPPRSGPPQHTSNENQRPVPQTAEEAGRAWTK